MNANGIMKMILPIILNSRCTIAVRFAFTLVPNDENNAVTHVPTLVPKIMNIAIGREISPLLASEITIAVIADEDCTSPVSAAPSRKRTIICHQFGVPPSPPIAIKRLITEPSISGSVSILPIEADITFIPMKMSPKP